MGKKALCIGINDYPGVDSDLSGCINDADDWASFLGKKGFDVGVLANGQATKSAIVFSIRSLLKSLKAGDTGVIQYSGHGTWVPDFDGDEPDRKDEALCPYDMGDDGSNLLLDDELRQLLTSRPAGTKVVLITDSCHSGTVFRFVGPAGAKRKIRFIPPSTFIKDAALLQKIAEVQHYRGSKVQRSDAPLPGVVHFSGCSDREYSYDAAFDNRPNGAFTYFALRALLTSGQTYQHVYSGIRHYLPSWDYPQSPRLNADKAMKNAVAFE